MTSPDAHPLGSVGAVHVPWTQVCPLGQLRLQCPQWCGSLARFTHVLPHRVLWSGQPQRRLPPFCLGGRHTSPFGQQVPWHFTRCDGQRPVTAAHASTGVIATAPAKAAPPARSASRRDIPLASPRATASSDVSPSLRTSGSFVGGGGRECHHCRGADQLGRDPSASVDEDGRRGPGGAKGGAGGKCLVECDRRFEREPLVVGQ
jgi:hypothetical protein